LSKGGDLSPPLKKARIPRHITHPPPYLPLEGGDFPPIQGEGQGGGGVKYVTVFMKYTTKGGIEGGYKMGITPAQKPEVP